MNINATINFMDPAESFPYNADEAAAKILAALDGDPEKDICTVSINMSLSGYHGAQPELPTP